MLRAGLKTEVYRYFDGVQRSPRATMPVQVAWMTGGD